MNYLLVSALNTYAGYYKNDLQVELPTGSGNITDLQTVAQEISKRLVSSFQKDEMGQRPVNDYFTIYRDDPNFKDLVLFYEYFHGDTARGVGASHQTGWTGVVAELINRISQTKKEKKQSLIEETVPA